MNDCNYHLGYRGGSGGFLLLHFLLLSDEYFTSFADISLNEAIDKQWNILDHAAWKSTETWPSNFITVVNRSNLKNLLYFCNPSTNEFFSPYCDFSKLIPSYDRIKDVTWPAIKNFHDFLLLPPYIKNELAKTDPLLFKWLICDIKINKNPKTIWVYTDVYSQNELAYYKRAYWYQNKSLKSKMVDLSDRTAEWNNLQVDKAAVDFLNRSDFQVKLQDFVNDPTILIDLKLIKQTNQEQMQLLNRWIKLHPPELLEKIGIHRKSH